MHLRQRCMSRLQVRTSLPSLNAPNAVVWLCQLELGLVGTGFMRSLDSTTAPCPSGGMVLECRNADSGSWELGRAATIAPRGRARLPEIWPRRRTGASTVSVTTGETTGRMRRLPGFDRPIRSGAPAAFASFVKAGRFYGRSAVLRTRQRLQRSRSKPTPTCRDDAPRIALRKRLETAHSPAV